MDRDISGAQPYLPTLLGQTDETLLDQYCSWLRRPAKLDKHAKPIKTSSSSAPLVGDALVPGSERLLYASTRDDKPTMPPESLVSDSPTEESRMICLLGRALDYDVFVGPVTHLYIFDEPAGLEYAIGIKLEKFDGEWKATPAMLHTSFFPFLEAYRVDADWMAVLVKLCKAVLRPLMRVYEKHKCGFGEINARLNYFSEWGPNAFFEDRAQVIAWRIARLWPTWRKEHASQQMRISELVTEMGLDVSAEEFSSLRPSAVIKSWPNIHRVKDIKCELLFSIQSAPEEHTPRHIRAERERRLFSHGGTHDLCYDTEGAGYVPEGDDRHVIEIGRKLWWWRGYVEYRWAQLQADLFRDNWERSAFCHEFHARQSKPYKWHPFGKPWASLNNSQRAMVALLWNVDRPGPATLRYLEPENISEYDDRMKSCVLDLRLSRAQLIESISSALQRQSHESEKNESIPISPNWKLLELMDLRGLLKRTMTPVETSMLSKVRKGYERVAQKAGLIEMKAEHGNEGEPLENRVPDGSTGE